MRSVEFFGTEMGRREERGGGLDASSPLGGLFVQSSVFLLSCNTADRKFSTGSELKVAPDGGAGSHEKVADRMKIE